MDRDIIPAPLAKVFELRRIFVFILALGLFTMAVRPVTDPDIGWHLRTGQLILQAHSVPHTDTFSFTKFGQPWVTHEWLSDVLIYLLYNFGGWTGMLIGFALVSSAALMLVYLRCPSQPYLAGLLVSWGAWASAPSWGVRPQMLSLLLASALLFIVDRAKQRPARLWFLVPLMLLWVNLHAGYATGIVLLGILLAGGLLDIALGYENWHESRRHLRTLALVLFACLAVVPLNPSGLQMLSYPIETLRSSSMQTYITEWFSPDFHQAKYVPFATMLLALLTFLAISPRRIRAGNLLLLLVVTWAALRSVRHIPIFVLIAVPLLGELLTGLRVRSARSKPATRPLTVPRLAMSVLLLITFSIFAIVRVKVVASNQEAVEAKEFPAKAVEYLSSHHLSGPILNHYNWGGYLIWNHRGDQVYIDGRADLYGDAFMNSFADTYYLRKPSWQDDLDRWRIRTVILPPTSPLVSALRITPHWHVAYEDSQAAILIREP